MTSASAAESRPWGRLGPRVAGVFEGSAFDSRPFGSETSRLQELDGGAGQRLEPWATLLRQARRLVEQRHAPATGLAGDRRLRPGLPFFAFGQSIPTTVSLAGHVGLRRQCGLQRWPGLQLVVVGGEQQGLTRVTVHEAGQRRRPQVLRQPALMINSPIIRTLSSSCRLGCVRNPRSSSCMAGPLSIEKG